MSGAKKAILAAIAAIAAAAVVFGLRGRIMRRFFAPTGSRTSSGITIDSSGADSDAFQNNAQILAENLLIPWDIAFLPNGSYLVTERGGRICF